ncbi:hypothetical protein [Azospirillum canadense]|nr:hypothetical protein [Azospirillum canadense]MCW2240945.1 hypothetical protein [Azospirillum canadense]
MVNRRMALFANLHVNDDARPEMHRLPKHCRPTSGNRLKASVTA